MTGHRASNMLRNVAGDYLDRAERPVGGDAE